MHGDVCVWATSRDREVQECEWGLCASVSMSRCVGVCGSREWVLVVGLSMEGVLIAGHLQIIIHRVLCIALWFIIPNTVFCVASERSGKAYLEHT